MRGGGSRDTPTPVSSVGAPSSPVRKKGGQSYSHSIPLSQFHTITHIPFHCLSSILSHIPFHSTIPVPYYHIYPIPLSQFHTITHIPFHCPSSILSHIPFHSTVPVPYYHIYPIPLSQFHTITHIPFHCPSVYHLSRRFLVG